MTKYEEALIAIGNAVNSKGLRIILMHDLPPRSPQGFVDRIHEITSGVPVNFTTSNLADYKNLAENVILLATALREYARLFIEVKANEPTGK